MGRTNAMGWADAVGEGLTSLENALEYHLRVNHFPPIDSAMVPVAMQAIEAAEDEDYGRHIALPEDVVQWRGMSAAPTWAIVEHLHLEPFIESGF